MGDFEHIFGKSSAGADGGSGAQSVRKRKAFDSGRDGEKSRTPETRIIIKNGVIKKNNN